MRTLTYLDSYYNWLENVDDVELKKELLSLENNDAELQKRFSKFLTFGTAGLRGVLGAGTNNVNVYTISKVTQAVSNYLLETFKNPVVVIAYDNRKFSYEFAKLSAEIFAYNNIKVKLFNTLTPTPILSYAVRKLKATFGVNITSSHNAKDYNGYKVVNKTGCQINAAEAAAILAKLENINEFKIKKLEFNKALEQNLIKLLDDKPVNEYLKEGLNYLYDYKFNKDNFNLIYTPLHGTGKDALLKGFKLIGVNNVLVPQSQIEPDSDFPTLEDAPNPEFPSTFNESFKLVKEGFNADLIIATDPDCDRVGVVTKHKKNYVFLTGDKIALILLHYILENKKSKNELSENSFFVNSVVSLELTNNIAKYYGVKDFRTLTGFKNIGKKIDDILKENKAKLKNQELADKTFVFAYEESIGYMISPLTRDKDGILPSLMLAIIASKLKNEGKSLIDYLEKIYNKFGYALDYKWSDEYCDCSQNCLADMLLKVSNLRNLTSEIKKQLKVEKIVDYLNANETGLEKSDFIELQLQGGDKIIVRPSGTEPVLKVYITIIGKNKKHADKKYKQLVKKLNTFKIL